MYYVIPTDLLSLAKEEEVAGDRRGRMLKLWVTNYEETTAFSWPGSHSKLSAFSCSTTYLLQLFFIFFALNNLIMIFLASSC